MVASGSSSTAAVAADRNRNLSLGNTYTAEAQTKHTHTHSHMISEDSVASSAYPSRERDASRGGQEASGSSWQNRGFGDPKEEKKKTWNKPEGKLTDETGRTGGWRSYTTISQNSHMDAFQLVRRRFGQICWVRWCQERQVLMLKDVACKQCDCRPKKKEI